MIATSSNERRILAHCIRASGALEFGDFLLKSGARSRSYLDLRRLTLSYHVRTVVIVFNSLTDGFRGIDAVGGPTLGADPIVGSILTAYADRDRIPRAFLVRSEEKAHGKPGLVVGSVRSGDRCFVVEDVVTTGGSLLRAIDAVESLGARVTHAACILDRLGVLAPVLKARGIDYASLLTLEDLGLEPKAAP